jgi:CBS domain-containing protein
MYNLAIVRQFMTKNPETISPGARISDATRIMAERKIGSLVVVGQRRPRRLLTERDLVSKVVGMGMDPETTLVGDVASNSVAEVGPEVTVKEAAKAMTSKKSRLLVIEDGKLVGIVTATDIIRAVHRQGSAFDPSRMVSRNVLTVKPDTTIRDAVGIMSKKRVGSVIVTKDDKPYGIFTERDLVKRVLAVRESLEKPVGDVATRQLVIARNDTDGKGAAGIMASKGIRRLLLLHESEMVGVLTARDLVEAYAAS